MSTDIRQFVIDSLREMNYDVSGIEDAVEGTEREYVFTFTDAGSADTHTATPTSASARSRSALASTNTWQLPDAA